MNIKKLFFVLLLMITKMFISLGMDDKKSYVSISQIGQEKQIINKIILTQPSQNMNLAHSAPHIEEYLTNIELSKNGSTQNLKITSSLSLQEISVLLNNIVASGMSASAPYDEEYSASAPYVDECIEDDEDMIPPPLIRVSDISPLAHSYDDKSDKDGKMLSPSSTIVNTSPESSSSSSNSSSSSSSSKISHIDKEKEKLPLSSSSTSSSSNLQIQKEPGLNKDKSCGINKKKEIGVQKQNSAIDPFVKAEEVCKEAIRSNPNSADAHFNFGFLLSMQTRYKEAVIEFRKAIDLNPNLADAHFCLGVAFIGLKKYEEAKEERRKAIRLDPNIKSKYNIVCNGLGNLLKK